MSELSMLVAAVLASAQDVVPVRRYAGRLSSASRAVVSSGDRAALAAAQAKRERKAQKRLMDAQRCGVMR